MSDKERISDLEKEVAFLKGQIDILKANQQGIYPLLKYYYYPEQRPIVSALDTIPRWGNTCGDSSAIGCGTHI